jgi:beta-lactamase regulating signal transducer with metallopeptidase domain/peroxiredoxin
MNSLLNNLALYSISSTWFDLVLDMTLKTSLILFFAWTLVLIFKRASSSTRHLIWSLAIVSLFLLPLTSFLLPEWEISILSISQQKKQSIIIDFSSANYNELQTNKHEEILKNTNTPFKYASNILTKQSPVKAQEKSFVKDITLIIKDNIKNMHWSVWIFFLWLFGATFFAFRVLTGYIVLQKRKKCFVPINNNLLTNITLNNANLNQIKRSIQLFQSNEIMVPFTQGWINPKIILPNTATSWGKKRQLSVILHELAHIKRYDCFFNFIARIVSIIYWFNPLVWYAIRQIYRESEKSCDDFVLNSGTKSSEYAEYLVDSARSIFASKWVPRYEAAIAKKSFLEGRLVSIFDPAKQRKSLNFSAMLAMVFLAISFSLIIGSYKSIEKSVDYNDAKEKIRALYFLRDFEEGQYLGKDYLSHFPDSLELKTWYIMNRLGNHYHFAEQAFVIARKMIETNPNNPWGYFLIAEVNYQTSHARKRGDRNEALDSSKKALTLLPDNIDMMWMFARALHFNQKRDEALKFLDEAIIKVKNPSELLVLKATILKYQSGLPYGKINNPEKWEQAKTVYDQAYATDSKCVTAFFKRWEHNSAEEPIPILKKALQISPYSNELRMLYWMAITRLNELSQEKKFSIIEEDISTFLTERKSYPDALLKVYNIYGDHELAISEKREIYGNLILNKFPGSVAAEWVLTERCRNLGKLFRNAEDLKDKNGYKKYRKMLQKYVELPHHHHQLLFIEAYNNLLRLAQFDSTLNSKQLLKIIDGILKFPAHKIASTLSDMALLLADRTDEYDKAIKIAQKGIKTIKSNQEPLRPKNLTDKEWEKKLGWQLTPAYDALGWAYFKKGDFNDAIKNLLYAHDLHQENIINIFHLGQFYETQKDYQKAESFYVTGIKINSPGENPNEKALEQIYTNLHGSKNGFTDYQLKLDKADREKRKGDILASLSKEPKTFPAFELESLTSEKISSQYLKGKTIVINFWGIWCGWCTLEMSEFQQLYSKYENNSDVVILSINNDPNQDKVRKWMNEKEFTFNVLFDDGYVKKVGVQNFPATWFINKKGEIIFEKQGWTKELFEEFNWRIEALQ